MIINNQKRFDNLYDQNPNVQMLNNFRNIYVMIFYGRSVRVEFSKNGWNIINLN